jgi:hypothetical protein
VKDKANECDDDDYILSRIKFNFLSWSFPSQKIVFHWEFFFSFFGYILLRVVDGSLGGLPFLGWHLNHVAGSSQSEVLVCLAGTTTHISSKSYSNSEQMTFDFLPFLQVADKILA